MRSTAFITNDELGSSDTRFGGRPGDDFRALGEEHAADGLNSRACLLSGGCEAAGLEIAAVERSVARGVDQGCRSRN